MVQKDKPVGAMVIRKKFDMDLVQHSVDNGSDFIDGKTVEDIKISNENAKVILDDKSEIYSKLVVGADGVWSTVAKKTGLLKKKRYTGICVLQEFNVDEDILDSFFGKNRMCSIHLKFRNMPGYGWVFPKKQHLNIGIVNLVPDSNISKTKKNLLDVYLDYIKTLKETKVIPKDLKLDRFKGGAFPVGPLEKTYANNTVIVGDAAGLINPITGEGIYYAMSSGEIAANVITKSLEANDTSEKFLSKYQKNWKKDFGRDIEILLGSTKNMTMNTEKFVKLSSKDQKLANIAIGIMNGEYSIREYKWKLIRRYLYVSFKDLFNKS